MWFTVFYKYKTPTGRIYEGHVHINKATAKDAKKDMVGWLKKNKLRYGRKAILSSLTVEKGKEGII